ncbi:ribosomal protein S18 acetylase RimI-like enzyme [Kribbella steppae]|uniref:Ribosomal protein S18 acetylase RimI-like enzyme n=1 Tax=Kribbella steppae TaxID=2512223 RepID=A0A4R2HMX9_9ACTN|nr:GNAT family N-acetyltransferase [Kribbella steppae]TCO32591.1 ribosomal protein S18 acetylase RimI-like enzyme [Kribbella steppae]
MAVRVELATEADVPVILGLAGEVEHWFGPMVGNPGFQRAVDEHVVQQRALVAFGPAGEPAGAVLFGGSSPRFAVHWLVVSDRLRGQGVGSSLMSAVMERLTNGNGLAAGEVVDVVTFGADHPGAITSGARVFYERLGFTPAEPAPDGPEGGSRQVFRLTART